MILLKNPQIGVGLCVEIIQLFLKLDIYLLLLLLLLTVIGIDILPSSFDALFRHDIRIRIVQI